MVCTFAFCCPMASLKLSHAIEMCCNDGIWTKLPMNYRATAHPPIKVFDSRNTWAVNKNRIIAVKHFRMPSFPTFKTELKIFNEFFSVFVNVFDFCRSFNVIRSRNYGSQLFWSATVSHLSRNCSSCSHYSCFRTQRDSISRHIPCEYTSVCVK